MPDPEWPDEPQTGVTVMQTRATWRPSLHGSRASDVSGLICLQGGREFTPECEQMDRAVIDRVGGGDVIVLAGAARVGSDYDGAVARARRHYEGLGAAVRAVPDPRTDLDGALTAVGRPAALLVLPGGSPSALLDVLAGEVDASILDRHRNGLAISGASAGAMVLCTQMVQPDRDAQLVDGLGLVDGLALPHWSSRSSSNWTLPEDVAWWGLPECGGVILDGDMSIAVGAGEPARHVDGDWTPIGRSQPT